MQRRHLRPERHVRFRVWTQEALLVVLLLVSLGAPAGGRVAHNNAVAFLFLAPDKRDLTRTTKGETLSEANGWQGFTLDKTKAERVREDPEMMIPGAGRSVNRAVNLPPAHDTLDLGLGFGYVQGADFGLELTGAGRLRGAELQFNALLTQGLGRTQLNSGRFILLDQPMGRGFEAGDMVSDTWGFARGFRYTWRADRERWPSLSLYLPSRLSQVTRPQIGYRDEFRIAPRAWLGGEITTDGAYSLEGRWQEKKLGVFAFHRTQTGLRGSSTGVFFHYNLTPRIGFYGGVSNSNLPGDQSYWRTLGLRFPLARNVELSLERTHAESFHTAQDGYAAMLTVPIGPIHLVTRYQWRNTDLFRPDTLLGVTGFARREWMTSLAYSTNPRMRFELQMQTQWSQAGSNLRWEQLVSSFRLSRRTEVQVISAFPQVFDPNGFRLRLNHALRRDLILTLDYGLLMPYQGVGTQPGERGLMVLVRSRWTTPTPARGAEVRGQVRDTLGQPLHDVAVLLGQYRTLTDARGGYAFVHVPAGEHELRIEEESLPADMQSAQAVQRLRLDHRSRLQIPLKAVPLNAISGWVYVDTNQNGQYDPGEGMRGAVVQCEGFMTATDVDGAFTFYNLLPGKHVIRLDAKRMPSYDVCSAVEVTVELPTERSLTGIAFRLTKRERPIVFQELP